MVKEMRSRPGEKMHRERQRKRQSRNPSKKRKKQMKKWIRKEKKLRKETSGKCRKRPSEKKGGWSSSISKKLRSLKSEEWHRRSHAEEVLSWNRG